MEEPIMTTPEPVTTTEPDMQRADWRKRLQPHAPAFLAGAAGAAVAFVVLLLLSFVAARYVFGVDFNEVVQNVTVTYGEDTVVNVAAEASDAVVSIVASKDMPRYEQYYENFGMFSIPRYRENGTEAREIGSGSGFIISADGYVVTNNHVLIDRDADYTVITSDGTEYDAQYVASDETMDVALLKIDDTELPYLAFGDSDALRVGQTVIAIGNALGEFSNTVSVGVVSGLSRNIVATDGQGDAEALFDLIQTDAAINSGNSGGPLLDLEGNVIGVNVAASLGISENIGFALPSNDVQRVIAQLREHGQVLRPYFGVRYTVITPEFAEQNGLDVDYGVLVRRGDNGEVAVLPGSPADKAGVEENDIILEVDGKKVEGDLRVMLREYAPDDVVTFTIMHDGEEKRVTATLTSPPEQAP